LPLGKLYLLRYLLSVATFLIHTVVIKVLLSTVVTVIGVCVSCVNCFIINLLITFLDFFLEVWFYIATEAA